MKKLFFVGLFSLFCLSLFGCGSKNDEESVVLPPTDDELLNLAAQALPCDEGVGFANFALLGTGISRQGNLVYYGVDEVMGFLPTEDGDSIRNTCYIISPVAMEIHHSEKGFNIENVNVVDTYLNNFLLEDYRPEFDGGKLDADVEAIFSSEAFAVRQQRNYWEYFLDYNDDNRKSYDERAMEYFNIEAAETEEFVSFYDNGAMREKGTYVDKMKEGTWTTYDEEGNVIESQDYVKGNPVEEFGPNNYVIVKPSEGFEEEINGGTLVLKGSYDDYTDYIFLTPGMWEGFLNPGSYGEEVTFKGKVVSVDGAAGSHYYNAEYVEELDVAN